MGILLAAVLFIISLVAGARLIKLGCKAVNRVFDELDNLL